MELLLANAIPVRETAPSFLGPPAIWVDETHYAKAAEIASSVFRRETTRVSRQWVRDWDEKFKGSYRLWLTEKWKGPGAVWRLFLLTLMLGLFVIYPLAYIVGSLIR